jgi:flagellar biosynthetic protein FlhB
MQRYIYTKLKEDFDLQLFASPEDEGRTEEPTERKIREAKRRGQIPKTIELPNALIILGIFIFLYFVIDWLLVKIYFLFHHTIETISSSTYNILTLKNIAIKSFMVFSYITLPMFIIAGMLGFFGNVVQVGFRFSTYPLKFDLSKIKFSFQDMIKKIFFSRQIAMNLIKTIIKVAIVSIVAYLLVLSHYKEIMHIADYSLLGAISLIFLIIFKIALFIGIFFLVLAIPDYIFQRREFIRSLKMTPAEYKRELKEEYGDPLIRRRIQEIQRTILQRNMIKEVPKADVVITNPTHFAVAIMYEFGELPPKVIAKGIDSIALLIKTIAKNNNVPIVEEPQLARELYYKVEIGEYIPFEFFRAVANILATIYKNNPEKMRLLEKRAS